MLHYLGLHGGQVDGGLVAAHKSLNATGVTFFTLKHGREASDVDNQIHILIFVGKSLEFYALLKFHEVANIIIDHLNSLFGAQSFQQSHIFGGETIVVAQLCGLVVGIGPDEGYLLILFGKRQQFLLVFEQHHRLARHLQGLCLMFLTFQYAAAYLGVGHAVFGVKHAQAEADFKEFSERDVYLLLGNQTLLYSLGQQCVHLATL